MKNLIVPIVTLFMFYLGISAIITGEISTIIGPGVTATHRLVVFQETPVRFIIELLACFGIGFAGLISLLKGEKNK
jgi:hypothetical protein